MASTAQRAYITQEEVTTDPSLLIPKTTSSEIPLGRAMVEDNSLRPEPVEMDDLALSGSNSKDVSENILRTIKESSTTERSEENLIPETVAPIQTTSINTSMPSFPPTSDPLSPIDVTISAIGPATDKPIGETIQGSLQGPYLVITLLIHTGARHPYTISERYLKKRNVNVTDHNPINMSVYTLKECIWRDWRDDWEPRPSSPSSIRLIHYGKMLDDKSHLKDGRFSLGDAPHVVHMTVKPQEVVDDEDARIAKGGGRDRDGNERSPGCRCVIL